MSNTTAAARQQVAGAAGPVPAPPSATPASRMQSSAAAVLQRTVGNRGLGALVHRRPVGVQTRLTISQPGDGDERQADHIADQVMRMPADSVRHTGTAGSSPHTLHRKCAACEREKHLHRKCAACEREEHLHRKCAACEEEEHVHREPAGTAAAPSADMPSVVHEALQAGGGRPLDASSRAFFEPRFGHDFGGVRIHTDTRATAAAHAVNARAFTVGQGIYFAPGEYRPAAADGRHLLAHELTHVLQQGGAAGAIQRQLDPGSRTSGGGIPPGSRSAPTGGREQPAGGRESGGGPAGRGTTSGPASPCLIAPGSGHLPGTSIMFARASVALSGGDMSALSTFASSWMSRGSTTPVRIDGYASVEGPETYNMGLSCRRAESIAGALVTLGIPRRLIATIAHGETVEFAANTLPPNRRAIVSEGPPTRVPRRRRAPRRSGCGGINDFFRTVLLIDQSLVSDIVTCVCFGISIADAIPIPAVGENPYVEAADCLCNSLTFLQEVFKRGSDGGCWDVSKLSATDYVALSALAAITGVDCFSLPLGTALGGFLMGLAGSEAGPEGVIVGGITGAALGDMIVDLAMMAAQNAITQGTPLPVSQTQACARLLARAAGAGRGAPGPRTPSRPRTAPPRTAPPAPSRDVPSQPRPTQPTTRPQLGPRTPQPTTPPPAGPATDGVCGPDVTRQVRDVLALTRGTFAGWTARQQEDSCDLLVRPPRAAFSWDILNLHRNAWILNYRCPGASTSCPPTPPHPVCATQGAHPACGSTVKVGPHCYYAGSANYVVFGEMCRLCHDRFPGQWFTGGMTFTEREARLMVSLYKGWGLAGDNVETARNWASAGYRRWTPGAPQPAPDRANCAPSCPTPYGGPAFDITWCPNTTVTYAECRSTAAALRSIARAIGL